MNETDLDNVKEMAKIFLEIEIGETEMSPAIVQHPFANSGFYPCRSDDGSFRIIDITTPQGFDEWKKIMRERIDSITSIGELFLYVNKPYSMTFLTQRADSGVNRIVLGERFTACYSKTAKSACFYAEK